MLVCKSFCLVLLLSAERSIDDIRKQLFCKPWEKNCKNVHKLLGRGVGVGNIAYSKRTEPEANKHNVFLGCEGSY